MASCSYVTPSRREGLTTERSFRHILWLLERATELMGPGVEDCVVLFNCASLDSECVKLTLMAHLHGQSHSGQSRKGPL